MRNWGTQKGQSLRMGRTYVHHSEEGRICTIHIRLYYHIELNPTSKRYCTIVLPFGKFEYQQIPMGLCNSPGIFQEKMSGLMDGLEFVRCYIDDLLCLTKGDFDDHLDKLEHVYRRLKEAGLKVH